MAGKVKGFTIMELMIVISIIAIITTFAALNAASWLRESRVNEGRDLLLSDIEQIKLKSMTGVPQAIFVAGGVSTGYTIRELVDNDDFVKNSGEGNTTLRTASLAQNVKISLNSTEELWFDRKGIPRTSGWGVQGRTLAVWYDSNGNNVADSSEYKKEVVLSAGGRIQYEK